jgi:probable F420-dependent oxidoreductase
MSSSAIRPEVGGHRRAFRFGAFDLQTASVAEYAEYARKVEALGYDVILCADHFDRRIFEPGPALTALALATSTLRVASLVFDNDFRHPALLAKEAATIDVLTGGRFEFGIGAGWHKQEYDQVGIPFEPPLVRVRRMQEAVHIIKAIWSEGPVTFSGRHYKIAGLTGSPRPVQRPHPPIFIGGGGKQVLTFAAQHASIVGIHIRALPAGGLDLANNASQDALAEKVSWVRGAAGSRLEHLELSILVGVVAVTDRPQAAAERLASGSELAAQAILESPHVLIGSVEAIVEALLEQRERYGISYIAVYEKDMQTFAPVVARLRGR